NDNTGAGLGSLYSNTTGSSNAAFGSSALVSNKSGNHNTGAGYFSLYNNLSGNSNIAIGTHAAYLNTTGSNSIAIGDSALYNNLSSYNVGVGSKALFTNTTGVSNTAFGTQSLYNNLTGSQNTAIGRIAMYANTTGIQNSAVGMQTMRYNQTGNANTALGFQSLFYNVTNSNNTAIGTGSLANTTSDDNTGIGQSSLNLNTVGQGNTAVGKEALGNNVSGSYNTAIGYKAAVYGNTFVNATAVGANAQSGCSNCVVLGSITGYNGATVNANIGIGTVTPQKTLHVNPNGAGGIFIGDNFNNGGYTGLNMGISQAQGGYSYLQGIRASGSSYGTVIINPNGGFVGIRTTTANAALHIKMYDDAYPITDAGLRIERAQNTNHWDMGVDFANDISYSYNGVTKFYLDNIDGTLHSVSDMRMKKDITTIGAVLPSIMKLEAKTYHYLDNPANAALSYGFLAQDVEKIFPDFVKTKGPDGMKAIGYQKLNIVAIKAIQEQQEMIEAQQKDIDLSKQQNAIMMEQIKQLQKAITEINKDKK
ncbi:MAG: tail fiber domain-containing protein, partial [Ferruginibacter sp.]